MIFFEAFRFFGYKYPDAAQYGNCCRQNHQYPEYREKYHDIGVASPDNDPFIRVHNREPGKIVTHRKNCKEERSENRYVYPCSAFQIRERTLDVDTIRCAVWRDHLRLFKKTSQKRLHVIEKHQYDRCCHAEEQKVFDGEKERQ